MLYCYIGVHSFIHRYECFDQNKYRQDNNGIFVTTLSTTSNDKGQQVIFLLFSVVILLINLTKTKHFPRLKEWLRSEEGREDPSLRRSFWPMQSKTKGDCGLKMKTTSPSFILLALCFDCSTQFIILVITIFMPIPQVHYYLDNNVNCFFRTSPFESHNKKWLSLSHCMSSVHKNWLHYSFSAILQCFIIKGRLLTRKAVRVWLFINWIFNR